MMKCFGSSLKVYRCKIVLLDETELIQEIKDSHKGQDILDIVFKHLDLLETVFFGLRFIDSKGFSRWLEPSKNAIKQVKEIEPITFYFGVKFYASDPCKLREECTRYQFFLQIKQDIQQSRLSVTNELAAQLLAYIIQSELGDYDPKIHQYGYVSEFSWIENQSLEFENKVCDLHKKLIGQIPAAVEMQFLERVKWLDLYGCELHSVVAEDRHEYFLGLGPHGIIVLKNKLKIGYYYWPRIEKCWRKGKFFMIKVIDKNNEEKTYGFEMPDRIASCRIRKSCKDHKEFFKLSQSARAQNVLRQLDGNKSPVRLIHHDFNRPNPSLVRISSRRFKRTGKPDGSEIPDDHNKSNNPHEIKSSAICRFNSTPSLPKVDYNSGSGYYRTESGLFSKSASASPLSVRSAFVARYDYGRMNYVSPMKRNASSSSLRRNRSSRSTDNDSVFSRNSSKIYPSNRNNEFETNSHRMSRSKKKHYIEPGMVEWNDIMDKRQTSSFQSMSAGKQCSSAVVKNVNKIVYSANESDSEFEDRRIISNANKINNPKIPNNKSVPNEIQKYIFNEPIDKNIYINKIQSESKLHKPELDYKIHHHRYKMNNIDNERFLPAGPIVAHPMINGYIDNHRLLYDKQQIPGDNGTPRYHYDQRNGNLVNSLNHSSPRVTFLPSHSTAYYSNNDDYSRNANNSTDHLSKDLPNKNINEMSTEL